MSTQPLTDKSPCPVNGRHTGTPMREVPDSYLVWLAEQPWLERKYPRVADYIRRNASAIPDLRETP